VGSMRKQQLGFFMDPAQATSGARIVGVYRYHLWRRWQPALGTVLWIMLNPSTADASFDDPTIRRCVGFAAAWGFGGIEVVNLFAFRATHPFVMMSAEDPVGPENDAVTLSAVQSADRIVAAWGSHGTFRDRGAAVTQLVLGTGKTLECLGVTGNKQPKHPVRLPGALTPITYVGGLA
jgi:hypothetical protein